MTASRFQLPTRPYPGLRPFEYHESTVFFGREQQVDELLGRLRKNSFLAVVGASGCGKSSLIRAGLLPALHRGDLGNRGSTWRIVITQPGTSPIHNLARSLLESGATADGVEQAGVADDDVALLAARLRRGEFTLASLIRDAGLPEFTNLLILVDQFEELFTQREHQADGESLTFVKLLLTTAQTADIPAHVVITMRSDFLGACSEFPDLLETLNDSQFLCPRLTHRELQQAIERPAAVFGGSVEPDLTARMLNDVGNDPDQLPLMQHVLMRLWSHAESAGQQSPALGLARYHKLGGLKEALSRHATEIYTQLKEDGDRGCLVEALFRALRERGENGQEVRRPVSIDTVARTVKRVPDESLIEDLISVVEAFRQPDCSFLTPPVGTPLTADSIINVGHESLIRSWKLVARTWTTRETEAEENYDLLCRLSRPDESGERTLLRGALLAQLDNWWTDEKPTPTWASRYNESEFAAARDFLTESQQAEKRATATEVERQEQELQTARQLADAERSKARTLQNFSFAVIGIALAAVALAVFAWRKSEESRQAQAAAEAQEKKASAATVLLAEQQKQTNLNLSHSLFSQAATHRDFENDHIRAALCFAESAAALETDERDAHARNHLLAVQTGVRSSMIHNGPVGGASFSKDESWVLTWSGDGTARLWDTAQDTPLRTFQHDSYIFGASFSKDESWVLTWSDDGTARLWNTAQDKPLRTFQHDLPALGALFSKDESRVLTWSDDGTARLWDTAAKLMSHAEWLEKRKEIGRVSGKWSRLPEDESKKQQSPHDNSNKSPTVVQRPGPAKPKHADPGGVRSGASRGMASGWTLGLLAFLGLVLITVARSRIDARRTRPPQA